MKNLWRIAAQKLLSLVQVTMLLWISPVLAQGHASETASAETFSAYDLRVGKSVSPQQCLEARHAVWVKHAYGEECIHYYPSPGLEKRSGKPVVPVLFFHGDHLSGSFPLGDYDKLSPKKLMQGVQANDKRYGVPFILIARPGVYDSSGDHVQRRRPKEFHSLNEAVSAIKRRYGLERVVIAGQSGGSTVGAALLTLGRDDVACAVLGSGNYDIIELAKIKQVRESLRKRIGCDVTGYCDPYNVIDFVGGIVADPNRLIAIVGDPTDNNTIFPLQKKFADAVKAAGHSVQLIEASGIGPDHHSLSHVTYRLAAACALTVADGKSPVSLDLAALVGNSMLSGAEFPASGFAMIDDVGAVPVTEKGKSRYLYYLTLPSPKAFVITEKGGWYFMSDHPDAAQEALDMCPDATQCWLYAVDDRVVWHVNPSERKSSVKRLDPGSKHPAP